MNMSRLGLWILVCSSLASVGQSLELCEGTLSFEPNEILFGETRDVYVRLSQYDLNPYTRKWYYQGGDGLPQNVEELQVQGAIRLRFSNVSYKNAGAYMIRLYSGTKHECDSQYATLKIKGCGELTLSAFSVTAGDTAYFKLEHATTSNEWQRTVNNGFDFSSMSTDERFRYSLENTRLYMYILKTQVSDSGRYRVQCQDGFSNTVKLNVIHIAATPPSMPIFQSNVGNGIHSCSDCVTAFKDKAVTISCSSEGGSEPKSLRMYKNGRLVKADISKVSTSLLIDATYEFTPTDEDFNTYFTCEVNNSATASPLKTNVSLYLLVLPEEVRIQVPPTIKEHEEQSISCTTLGGRPPLVPSFYFNGLIINTPITHTSVTTGYTHTVNATIRKTFTRDDNRGSGSIMCRVHNNTFVSKEDTKRIQVLFPPVEASLDKVKEINKNNGDTYLKLRLHVWESNPVSKVEWHGLDHLQPDYTHTVYNSLTTGGQCLNVTVSMNLTHADNKREIKAVVTNPMFPEKIITKSYVVNITYAPVITIGEGVGTVTLSVGDDTTITCHVDSNPDSRVFWYNETADVKSRSLDLHLVNVTVGDAQTYTCKAENSYGTDNKSIKVLVKDTIGKQMFASESSPPISGQMIGIIAGVGGFVIAVVVVVICAVKLARNRKQQGGPSNELIPDEAANIEDNKQAAGPSWAVDQPLYGVVNKATSSISAEQDKATSGTTAEPDKATSGTTAEPDKATSGTTAEPDVEYAVVIPKSQRPVPAEDNKKVPKSIGYRNEDGLLYADLELHQEMSTIISKPVIRTEEETAYISVDFNKVGQPFIEPDDDLDPPDGAETTE